MGYPGVNSLFTINLLNFETGMDPCLPMQLYPLNHVLSGQNTRKHPSQFASRKHRCLFLINNKLAWLHSSQTRFRTGFRPRLARLFQVLPSSAGAAQLSKAVFWKQNPSGTAPRMTHFELFSEPLCCVGRARRPRLFFSFAGIKESLRQTASPSIFKNGEERIESPC